MMTITVTFDTPLPQGMLDVEVLKFNAVQVKRLNENNIPVYTDEFQYWTSSSKATGTYVNGAHMYCTSSS